MSICPNFSNPEFVSKFEKIEADPELGRVEAVREFLESQREGREMLDAEGIKKKLNRRFSKSNQQKNIARYEKAKEALSEVTSDQTYIDPDSLSGHALLMHSSKQVKQNAINQDLYTPAEQHRKNEFDKKAKEKLFNFIKGLNIEIAEDQDDLLDSLNLRTGNPMSAFDTLQKFLALRSDITNKDLALQSANIIYTFLGRKSKLGIELWKSVHNWEGYQKVYNKFKAYNKVDLIVGEYENDSESFSGFAHKQAIIHLIAEMLEHGINLNYTGEKRVNPDIVRDYFIKLGHRDKYVDNFLLAIFNKVWNWIQKNVFGKIPISVYNNEQLKDLVLDIVDDVYKNDYSKFLRSYKQNSEGDFINEKGELMEQKFFKETIEKDPYAWSVFQKLANHPFINFKLSGSLVVRKYGRLIRTIEEDLHDIDGVITVEQFRKEAISREFRLWVTNRGLQLTRKKEQKKFFKEVQPWLDKMSWYINVKEMFPSFKLHAAFIGKDHKNGESITITGKIDHATEKDENGNPKKIVLDFFLRTAEGSYPEIFDNYFKDWKQIFEAKLMMGRAKDIADLVYFDPFIRDKYKFTNRGYRYFTFADDRTQTTNDLIESGKDVKADDVSDNIYENQVEVYQGYNGSVDQREFQYFAENKAEAQDYGGKVRKVTVDTRGFLIRKPKDEDNYWKEKWEFRDQTGISFDILDSSPEGLKNQEKFFKFLKNKGYRGIDMTGGFESNYLVTFYPIETYQQKVPVTDHRDRQKAKEIASRLADQLGVKYEVITAQQAVQIASSAKNPINIMTNTAFFYGDTVYFIEDRMNTNVAIHEFSHPLIRAIQKQNPALFKKLLERTLKEDSSLLEEAFMEYEDLRTRLENIADPQERQQKMEEYVNLVEEEVLVKALTKIAKMKMDNIEATTGFKKLINDILYAIKKLLRSVFGKNINIAKIDENTSMSELAQLLLEGGKFDIDMSYISNKDIIAYQTEAQDYVEDLSNYLDKVDNQAIMDMISNAYEGARRYIHLLDKSDNYTELAKIIGGDETKAGDLKIIKERISKYANIRSAEIDEVLNNIEDVTKQSSAIVSTVMQLDIMMEKIENHVKELSQLPEDQDNLHKAKYYSHFIDHWKAYIENAIDAVNEAGAVSSSPISQLLQGVANKIKSSEKSINKIRTVGVAETLWDTWKSLAQRADDLHKQSIDNLKAKGASQDFINKRIIEYYGMLEDEYAEYLILLNKLKSGSKFKGDESDRYQELSKKADNGHRITKDKIEAAVSGQSKDASWINSYLEGYMYNTDPVLGGFAMYFKNNMSEMEARAQVRHVEMMKELEPLLKQAGIDFKDPGYLGQTLGTLDVIGRYNKETGKMESKQIWTLLSPHINYRFEIDSLDNEIKQLKNKYYRTGDKEDYDALVKKYTEKKNLLREWFHQPFIEEYYYDTSIIDDEIVKKKGKDDIGEKAEIARETIINKINQELHPLMNESDVYFVEDKVAQYWREYRALYSEYNLDGSLKTGEDLQIAQRLKSVREKSRKYYEWVEREGAFEEAFKNFQDQTRERLKKNKDLDPDAFEDEFNYEIENWLKKNTRVVIKDSFYTKRAEIIERIAELTKNVPELDFSQQFSDILDLMSPYRDDDMQPIGTEMDPGRLASIKALQEEMERLKSNLEGVSGLTKYEQADFSRLSRKFAEMDKSDKKNDPEWNDYIFLIQKMNIRGIPKEQKKKLIQAFEELNQLQSKIPTEYYLDSLNYWIEKLDVNLYNELGLNAFDESNIDQLYQSNALTTMLEDEGFYNWFTANHFLTEKFDFDSGEVIEVWERTYAWNVVVPNDYSDYETTTVTVNNMTFPVKGLPKLKYYRRVVKDEFKTGYDPITKEVKRVVGVHIDNRGSFLPRIKEGSKYINQKYFDLQNAKPGTREEALFKILQVLTKHHLKNQEGLNRRSKLYLDFPRFQMSTLELVRSKGVKQALMGKGNPLKRLFQRLLDYIRGAVKSDTEGKYNWQEEAELVRADAFNDEIENLPIQGIYDLEWDETSTNIIDSMLRYLYGAEHQKQLYKMNPMAESLKKMLNDPLNKQKDKSKVDYKNYTNWGIISWLNKKGKYVRQDAFNNFYEKNFLKQNTVGPLANANWLINIQKFLFGKASFSFFAFNIPSALKNQYSGKWQALIESASRENITPGSLIKGESWAYQYMFKLSFGDAYARGQKSLMHQLGEYFDPSQGRTKEKFGDSATRTLLGDAFSTGWFYNFRKWTELQTTMQTFAAMMYKKKIPMGDKTIDYMDAWTLDKQGRLTLKEGIDPKWGITYDEEDNPILGQEFLNFKNRIHIVMTKLQGAYADYDQPEAQRWMAFRTLSYLRRYFTTMAVSRFSKKRWSPGYGEIDEGYYVAAVKAMWTALKNLNLNQLESKDKGAILKAVTEWALWAIGGFIITGLFGYDDDDDERFDKLRKLSGALPSFMVKSEKDRPFHLLGWLDLHMMNLVMQVRAENEQFLPYKLSNYKNLQDMKSIALGPTINSYIDMTFDIMNYMTGDDRAYYKRRAGSYKWQQKGSFKLWSHLGKTVGVRGSLPDPAQMIINFQKAQQLALFK